MKNFKRLLAIVTVLTGLSSVAFAQPGAGSTATSASTDASATIVAPITISVGTDMAFGSVVRSAAGGTVQLSTAGVRTASGVSFSPTFTGSPTASSFTVGGEANYTYAISFPSATVTLTKSLGTETMTVGTFTSNPSTTGVIDAGGTQTLLVGATLNVGTDQVSGLYEGTYTVKVDYN